jgi:ribonucleotide monophosphatase NagD (HAD superfamily)
MLERIVEYGWLDDLVARYDVFPVVQFGVLHDGRTPHPGAAADMKRLKAIGKKAVVISKSGKRSASNVLRLTAIGIPADDYISMITSGAVAWRRGAACLACAPIQTRSC